MTKNLDFAASANGAADENPTTDFQAKLQRLRSASAKTTTAPLQHTATNLFHTAANDSVHKAEKAVQNTAIYKLLDDDATSNAEKVKSIAKLLTLDFTDPENAAQFESLAEIQTIIKALIDDFTAQSRVGIEAVKNNPLAALTANIRTVFENYQKLNEGRVDLKDKLATIQKFMDKNGDGGGEAGLLKALSDARTKKNEKDQLEQKTNTDKGLLSSATDALETINDRENAIALRLEEIKKSNFLTKWRPSIRSEKEALTTEKVALADRKSTAEEKLGAATTTYTVSSGDLKKFLEENDFNFYEEILAILDIGNAEFKDKLKEIAQDTLQYIDHTNETFTGVRNQLRQLLDEVKRGVDVSVNTSEKIAVLQDALTSAQDHNATNYLAFKTKAPETDPLDQLERQKLEKTATHFTSELSRNITASTEIAGNVETHQTTMGQLRTDLENGVVNADSQLLKAVSTSAATGQTMLQRTQRLAAMAQSIVADSMYQHELAETFDAVQKDFAAELHERTQRNSQIGEFATLIDGLSTALDTHNDQSITIAQEQVEMVENLASKIKKLEIANKNAGEIDAAIAVNNLERHAGTAPA